MGMNYMVVKVYKVQLAYNLRGGDEGVDLYLLGCHKKQ